MNAVRSAVRVLFVVFASNPCMSAMAQSPEHQPAPVPSIAEYKDAGLDDFGPYWSDACPSVYAQVDALFMMRQPRFAQQPMVVDDETGTTLLSTSDLDFNFEPGLRATVGMRLCGGRALEFSYFGLWQGDASAFVEAADEESYLIFPGNFAGNAFVDMDWVRVNYSSWLHSFELNLPCRSGCCESDCGKGKGGGGGKGCGQVRCRSFEWFAGLRYLNLGERLDIATQRTVADGIENGSYNLRTSNHLYGAQLGARLRRSQGSFGWEATGKAGIFGNDSQQTQSVTDFPDFQLPGRTVSSSRGGVAFVGEVNLSALVRLTDVWNVRTGYNAMWIEGLALAPDQLDFDLASAPSGVRNGGGMFLHGVNVGLEARW